MTSKVTWRGDQYRARIEEAVTDSLVDAAFVAADAAKRSMPGAGAARLGPRKYRPSIPGAPPGIRTGTLRRSITAARLGPLRAAYGSNVTYARYVEFDRPFLRIALAMSRNAMSKRFAASLTKRLERNRV